MSIICHGIKHYRFTKMMRRWGRPVIDKQIISLLESLKIQMGINRQISIHQCPFIDSPMILGLVKPQILLTTAKFSQDELYFILKHELVHYKRKDLVYKYLVLVAVALHWFNPIVRLMAKAVNALCETSCDEEVLRSADMETRHSYGETIIGVARRQAQLQTLLLTTFYGGKKNMKKRILSIMDMRKKKIGIGIICLMLVSALAIGGIIAQTRAVDPVGQEDEASDYVLAGDASSATGNADAIYTIVHAESGARFNLNYVFTELSHGALGSMPQSKTVEPQPLDPMYISLEEAAIAGANAIFEELEFNLDGMDGYIYFKDAVWNMFITSEELTTHSMGSELFIIQINGVSGEIISARMNTPETPFHG
jgi:hypothetical protein